jgi:hypothetical protein
MLLRSYPRGFAARTALTDEYCHFQGRPFQGIDPSRATHCPAHRLKVTAADSLFLASGLASVVSLAALNSPIRTANISLPPHSVWYRSVAKVWIDAIRCKHAYETGLREASHHNQSAILSRRKVPKGII